MKKSDAPVIDGATDNRLLVLSPADNVAVVRQAISAGEKLMVSGCEVVIAAYTGAGHKIARCDIGPGDKVLKYGVPIGSATCPIVTGDHVHLHNIKSDYTHALSLETARKDHERNTRGGPNDL